MSYTLRGRIESRLVGALPALIAALALHRWWAIELVALMLAIQLALDVAYDRLIAFQPAWFALPLGALELGLAYAAVRALDVMWPQTWMFALFGIAWLGAQLFVHAILPRARLEYGETGGELGRGGALTAVAVAATLVAGVGAAYAVRPPTVHLHGTVQGPVVITHAETLVGGVVRGGIIIRASHVTLDRVTVVGGEYGVNIEHAQHVMLDRVRVVRPLLDGIRATDAGVMISKCTVSAPRGNYVTGVLISYSMGRPTSMVDGCTIVGTREGIATHSSEAMITNNHVVGTSERGILLGEMSMDMASHNTVEGAKGIGIICMDHSMCEIEHNTVAATQRDGTQDATRGGVGIEAFFYAQAKLFHNTLIASPGGVRAFDNSVFTSTLPGM